MSKPSSWVFGLRGGTEHRDPWQLQLFSQLTGELLAVKQGDRTSQAEKGFGFKIQYSYYFLDICVPSYGFLAVAFDRPEGVAARVLPFDSGGLWHGRYSTGTPMLAEEKSELVAREDMDDAQYGPRFESWLSGAFMSPADYSNGVEPKRSYVAAIPVAGNNQHAWLWEGRLPRQDYETPPGRAQAVMMSGEDAAAYTDWLELYSTLDDEEMTIHMEVFAQLLIPTEDPVANMNSLIGS